MSKAVLTCQGLQRKFHDGEREINVLDQVDLEILPGEQIAILGVSGAGKSTLLQILGGLDKPTAGQVLLDGEDIYATSENRRCELRNQYFGFVYQFHHLLPEFTALENVAMPLCIRGVPTKKAYASAEQTLTKVGLSQRLTHYPSQLSGGERQRTAIARALVGNPRFILADEPTGNLDQHTAEDVYETMLGLNRELNTSIIIVTHDQSLAQRMDRVLQLQEGRLVVVALSAIS